MREIAARANSAVAISVQCAPSSSERRMPAPSPLHVPLYSPVPAKTREGLAGSIAIVPIESVIRSSVSGVHVAPRSVVFHTPPVAVPMYTVDDDAGCTAIDVTRPATGMARGVFDRSLPSGAAPT